VRVEIEIYWQALALLVGRGEREVPLTEVESVDTVDGEKCVLVGWKFEKRAGSMRVRERR
jgi:hypothetical protein